MYRQCAYIHCGADSTDAQPTDTTQSWPLPRGLVLQRPDADAARVTASADNLVERLIVPPGTPDAGADPFAHAASRSLELVPEASRLVQPFGAHEIHSAALDRIARPSVVLAGGTALALLVGLASAIQPIYGLAVVVALAIVVGFSRSFTFAACGFAIATYGDLLTTYTGPAFSPIKLAGAGIVIVAALAGVSRTRDRAPAAWRSHPLVVAGLAGYLLVSVASAGWAVDLHQVSTISIRLITDGLVFLAFGVLLHDARQLRALAWAICIAAAGACLVGAALHTQLAGRALGTFSDPNEFAAALVPAIALAYVLFDTARSRLARYAVAVMALVSIWTVLETQSRGGLIALLVGAATIFITARGRELVRLCGVLLVATCCGAVFVVATPGGQALLARVNNHSSSGRTDIWKVARNEWKAHPVHGVGLGNFPIVSAHYLSSDVEDTSTVVSDPRTVHDVPLELLAELGLVGFCAYVLFAGGCWFAHLRAVRLARRSGDQALTTLARGLLAATTASLATGLFISGQYAELQWVLLACGPVSLALARRALVKTSDAPPSA